MFQGIGFVVVFACVFGGYLISGGKMGVVLHALPHEMLTIAGGAIGAFIVANGKHVLVSAAKGLGHVFKGPRWSVGDYKDLLCLLFLIVREMRGKGALALESHIENPKESALFSRFPRLAADHHLIGFICDYLRMMTLDLNDPYQAAEIAENDIDRLHHEELQPQMALQVMADGLPAIGIVAAVLGVIKTMASIDQPTEVLGAMIGGALVGTFLGVLLSYCVVGPLAARLGQIIEEEGKTFGVVKSVLIAHLQGMNPITAVEIGRRAIPSHLKPGFNDVEAAMGELPRDLNAMPNASAQLEPQPV